MPAGQVTIGAAATQVSTAGVPCSVLVFQNNAAHACRYANDSSVSVTTPGAVNGGTAGKGILLASGSPGGSGTTSPVIRGTMLNTWYIAGTQGDVIDYIYEPT
jgi:hypothetical protein